MLTRVCQDAETLPTGPAMFSDTHQDVVVEAAKLNGGQYARIVLGETFWIEKAIAGAICDGIIRDWLHQIGPSALSVIRRAQSSHRFT